MAKGIEQHFRGNVVAYLALFVALGGSAYAVTALDRNSVKSKHIVNGQVKRADIAANAVNASKLAANAVNADKLASDTWHEVATASGLGTFFGFVNAAGTPDCYWQNVGGEHQTAAFFRDVEGIVHLKGLVQMVDEPNAQPCGDAEVDIFQLPEGYRPEAKAHFATVTDAKPGRVAVFPDGTVLIAAPGTLDDAHAFVSLDGLDFPAAG